MKKKKILILILCLLILGIGGITVYATNQKHKYNNYITQANELISNGNYSNAEILLSKAKNINDNAEVSNLLKQTKSLEVKKELNEYINQTKELIKSHKYNEAKQILEKAKSIDGKNHEVISLSDTIDKDIKQQQEEKIKEYLKLGTDSVRDLNMHNAFNYFKKVLEIDPNNTEALSGINEGIYDYYNEMINEDINSNKFDDAYKKLNEASNFIKERYNLYKTLNKNVLKSPEKNINDLKNSIDNAKKTYNESKNFTEEKAVELLKNYLKEKGDLKDGFFVECDGNITKDYINEESDPKYKDIIKHPNYHCKLFYDVYMDENKTAAMTHTIGWYIVTPDSIYSQSIDLSTLTKIAEIKNDSVKIIK